MEKSLKQVDENLQRWYQSHLGQTLLQQEVERSSTLCRLQQHHRLLQIGGTKHQFKQLAATDASTQYIELGQLGCGQHPLIIPTANQQQLRPQSFAQISLHHILEFYQAPVPLLKDCFELLSANGHIVIYAFNPWSIWGLAKLINQRSGLPWQGKAHSAANISLWLEQIGFSSIRSSSFCFRPPLQNSHIYAKLAWMEKVGRWCWPYCGASYQIIAQKRQTAPLATWRKWSQKKASEPHLTRPVSRRKITP